MKFAIAKEHRDFFRQHRSIEFDGLLSAAECHQLMTLQRQAISDRMIKAASKNYSAQVKVVSAGIASPFSSFVAGFDLWRANAPLKKIILKKTLAETASELLEIKPIRIGYDQLFQAPSSNPISTGLSTLRSNETKEERSFLSSSTTLQEMSSIQGILSGVMICIDAPDVAEQVEDSSLPPSIFSTKIGNGVFFLPDADLNFNELANRQDSTYLMIAYTKAVSVYCKVESDPHTVAFQKHGYHFGDRLSDRYHPLVFF